MIFVLTLKIQNRQEGLDFNLPAVCNGVDTGRGAVEKERASCWLIPSIFLNGFE